jgi:serine/threonine protein kinase
MDHSGQNSLSRRLKIESQARVGTMMGRWKLERFLGFGSAAAVYTATDGAQVSALKTLHKSNQANEQVRARFKREAEVTMSIDHENVVKVYDIGTSDEGELFMAMEMLDGLALDEFLSRKGGKLGPRNALRITQQLLAGLAASHAKEVVHRDLKPSNVYITRQRVIKLLDFGVAHVEQADQRLTMDGTVLGTPAFMPPEQARGRLDMLDARSDTFAVGAVLFHMLTGRYVHEGTNIDEALILAATRPAESIARFESDLPERVIALVDKALSWNPAKRFANAGEMLAEVEGCLDVKAALNARSAGVGADSASAQIMAQSAENSTSEETEEEEQDGAIQDEDLRELLSAAEVAFQQFERSLDMARKYSWGHQETQAQIRRTHEALLSCISIYPDEAIFTLRPYSFSLANKDVWEPREPFDEITYNMFSCGIRSLHFKPTLPLEEFVKLLGIMMLDPRKDLPPEDDLGTAIWEANLEHIQVQMVSTFRLDDAAEQATFLENCEEEQARVERFMGEARKMQVERAQILLSMGEDAIAEAQGAMLNHEATMGQESPLIEGAINKQEVARLAAVLNSDPPLDQQLPYVLAETYREAMRGGELEQMHESLRDYFARFVRRKQYQELLRTHARLCLALRDPNLTAQVTAEMFTPEIFDTVLDALTRGLTEHGTEQERVLMQDKATLENLKELLVNLGSQHAGAIARLYPRVQNFKPFVRLFYAYLRKHLTGNEEHVGEIIPKVELPHAKAFIELLQAQPDSSAAVSALRHANYHPDPALKLELLEWRAARAPESVAIEVMDLARGDAPDLRVRAFQIAKRHNVPGLAQWISDRAREEDFYDLPYSERRLMLSLLLAQDQRLAFKLAVELITTHGLTANPTRDTTRLLAVEILRDMPTTPHVLEALDVATKRRPWNSKELQEAAAAAIKHHRGGR